MKYTLSTFIRGLTLDVPLTCYNNNTLMASDFIYDDMKAIKTLNNKYCGVF